MRVEFLLEAFRLIDRVSPRVARGTHRRLVPAVERALLAAGLTIQRVQVSPGSARLVVESGDDRTELDLPADARLFPAEAGEPAPMLRGEELAVDKVLALFGRAEARDFLDLMEIEPRYGLDRLCRLAGVKDRGFASAVLAEMLGRFSRLRRVEVAIRRRAVRAAGLRC